MDGQNTSAGNMQWDSIVKTFKDHWKTLCDKKKEDVPDIPKISKSLPIIKWTEAFSDFMAQVVGAQTVPLSCIVRKDANVSPIGPLTPGQPFSLAYELLEEELIDCTSHSHALFKEDNAQVYFF